MLGCGRNKSIAGQTRLGYLCAVKSTNTSPKLALAAEVHTVRQNVAPLEQTASLVVVPRKRGSPITKALILSRCRPNPVTGCWEWMAAKHKYGYGEIRDGKSGARASRKAYELWNGPIPEGRCVLHRCDNPPCCNPDHLFIGTHQDNMRDASMKGRLQKKLSPEQVASIRADKRLYRIIAAEFSIGLTIISNIKSGKRRPA